MKHTLSKPWPSHLTFFHPAELPWTRTLDQLRHAIQMRPLKFVVLTAWTAFFLGLVARG